MKKLEKILWVCLALLILIFIFYKKGYFGETPSSIPEYQDQQVTPMEQEIVQAPEADLKSYQKVVPIQKKSTKITEKKQNDYQSLSSEDFLKLLKDYAKNIPVRKDMSELDSTKVHHIPDSVVEMGRKLGEIKEILAKRPDLEEEGMTFYTHCAQNPKALDSIRALCLTNLIIYKRKKGEEIDVKKYPQHIVELSLTVLE